VSAPIAETEKTRASFTPTELSEDAGSSAGEDYQSHKTTAGLFIRKPTDKPLPLSVQRTIPLPRFWKKLNGSKPRKAAPDILRRTGSTSALFSHDSTFHQPEGDAHVSWPCRHRNLENRNAAACELNSLQEQQSHQSNHQQQERHRRSLHRQTSGDSTQEIAFASTYGPISCASARQEQATPSLASPVTSFDNFVVPGHSLQLNPYTNYAERRSPSHETSSISLSKSHINGVMHQLSPTPAGDKSKHGTTLNLSHASRFMPLDNEFDIHNDGKSPNQTMGAPSDESDGYSFYSSESPGLFTFMKQKLGKSSL
jgi:hypothetical protein